MPLVPFRLFVALPLNAYPLPPPPPPLQIFDLAMMPKINFVKQQHLRNWLVFIIMQYLRLLLQRFGLFTTTIVRMNWIYMFEILNLPHGFFFDELYTLLLQCALHTFFPSTHCLRYANSNIQLLIRCFIIHAQSPRRRNFCGLEHCSLNTYS